MELTTLGKNEAAGAATSLWQEGFAFDVAFSSRLKRAMQTLDIVLHITDQEDIPVHRTSRLNERMYGALTGLNKQETTAKYGEAQVASLASARGIHASHPLPICGWHRSRSGAAHTASVRPMLISTLTSIQATTTSTVRALTDRTAPSASNRPHPAAPRSHARHSPA